MDVQSAHEVGGQSDRNCAEEGENKNDQGTEWRTGALEVRLCHFDEHLEKVHEEIRFVHFLLI